MFIKNIKKIFYISSIALFSALIFPITIFASTVDGTILSPDKYAWGENVGWVNFAADHGDVHVTDTGLSGYIWDSVYGWINLNPLHGGVKNDTNGNLSGKAWSAGTGFIDFTGVSINSSGKFTGIASGPLFGRLNFDCLHCSVITDYRPGASLIPPTQSSSSGFPVPQFIVVPITPEIITIPASIIEEINRQNNATSTVTPPVVKQPTDFELLLANFPALKDILIKLGVNVNQEGEAIKKMTNINFTLPTFLTNSLSIINIFGIDIPSFPKIFNPGLKTSNPYSNDGKLLQTALSPQNINSGKPLSLSSELSTQKLSFWELFKARFSTQSLSSGKPLQSELSAQGVNTTGPSLQTGLPSNDIENFKGLSLVDLPVEIKKGVPEEVLFVRAGNSNIDIPINLKVSKNGQLDKSVELISNKTVTLIVKPKQDKKVDVITGYFVFKSKFSSKSLPISAKENILSNLVATAYAEGISNLPKIIPDTQVEDMMVLMKFELTDNDHDGLYTANINTPYVEGNYEIVAAINYQGEKTPKVLRLITVIDPEGYVYEVAGINETRIRNATVIMLKLNESTNKYENWNAKDFAQKNPQITNQTGEYSYLVPEGTYQLKVEAEGYKTYYSKVFTASEGDSLHENIQLISTRLNLSNYWIILILLIIILLILYYKKINYIIKSSIISSQTKDTLADN